MAPASPLFWSTVIGVLLAAYLLGGIPWALIIGRRFYGIDPREHGSGNMGATNVFRVLGARAGAVTLLLDASKGAVAVGIAMWLVPESTVGPVAASWVSVGAMAAAVLGHSYPPYTRFKGGKGVATSAGALLVLAPLATVIALGVFVAVVAASRMVSAGSVVAAIIYPFIALRLYSANLALQITIFLLAALVIWRHRTNIRRIFRGEERKISFDRKDAEAEDTTGGGS